VAQVKTLGLVAEFERAFIALLARDPELYTAIGQWVEPESLTDSAAVKALEAIHAMHADGIECRSAVTLVQYIATNNEGRIKRQELSQLASTLTSWTVPSGFSSKSAIDVLAPKLRTRHDHKIALEAARVIATGSPDSVRKLIDARDRIGAVATTSSVELSSAFQVVRELRNNERLTTGSVEIDDATDGGLWLGAFAMTIAGYGGGKSIYLIQQSAAAWLNNILATVVTLELPPALQYSRWLACVTGVPTKSIVDGSLEHVAQQRLAAISEKLGGSPPFSVEQLPRGAKPSQLFEVIDRREQRLGQAVRCVVLDYLDEMEAEKPTGRAYDDMRRVCQALANWAGDTRLKRWLWTASQAQRHNKEQKTKRVTGDNVADSINKLRVVDMALSMNVDPTQTSVEIHKSKYRLGSAGEWIGPLPVDFARSRIGGFDAASLVLGGRNV